MTADPFPTPPLPRGPRSPRSWFRTPGLWAIAAGTVLACAGSPAATPPSPASSRTVWSGVFTAAQASRGGRAYARSCARCHGDDLRGGETSPALVGRSFLSLWEGASALELFEVTKTTMPEDAPESLPDATYADLVAHILEGNGFPAGSSELSANAQALATITIRREPPGGGT